MFDPQDISRKVALVIVKDTIRARCLVEYDEDSEPLNFACKIDTGATRSVFPQKFWMQFKDNLELNGVAEEPMSCVGSILNARRVTLKLMLHSDNDNGWPVDLGDCEVLLAYDSDRREQAMHDYPNKQEMWPQELSYILLGLGGGPLKNGGLCIDWVDKKACLVFAK